MSVTNKKVGICRVSGKNQDASMQSFKINNYLSNNNILAPIFSFVSSGYNGREALKQLEDQNVTEAIFTHPNRFCRDELEAGMMMKKRKGKPLKLIFIDTDETYIISGSSPSQWPKELTRQLEIAKNSSEEKSQISVDYFKSLRKKNEDFSNAPPGLMREGKRCRNSIIKTFGYMKTGAFTGYIKRKYSKFGGKISEKYARKLLESIVNYKGKTRRLKCCRCLKSREVSQMFHNKHKNNFRCNFLSFTQCQTEEITENLEISHNFQNVSIEDQELEEGYFKIEDIIDSRTKSNKKEYKVKWMGNWTENKTTWEALNRLKLNPLVLDNIIDYENNNY